MKNTLSMISILTVFAIVIGCSNQGTVQQENIPLYGNLTIAKYGTLEEIVNTSPIIVEVRKTDVFEKKVHERLDYTTTKVEVKNVIKGDRNLYNKEINIVELDQLNMTDYDRVQNYVLFLYPHNGKIASDGYWIRGVYQGKFKLDDNNQMFYDSDKHGGIMTFQNDLTGLTVSDLENLVTSITSEL